MKKTIAAFLRGVPIVATGLIVYGEIAGRGWAHESRHAHIKILIITCVAGIVIDLIVIAATHPLMPKAQTQRRQWRASGPATPYRTGRR